MSEYKRHPNSQCIVCGKAVYRRPCEFKRNRGRVFCSMACYGRACRKEVPCVVCGKSILRRFNKKTCSRSCANKNRAGIQYRTHRLRDKVVTQRALKVRLLTLHGNNCERCGYAKIEILQIHHKDKNRENNDLNNLELICPNCHFEEHYLEKSWLRK